jgi:hypothetical protein
VHNKSGSATSQFIIRGQKTDILTKPLFPEDYYVQHALQSSTQDCGPVPFLNAVYREQFRKMANRQEVLKSLSVTSENRLDVWIHTPRSSRLENLGDVISAFRARNLHKSANAAQGLVTVIGRKRRRPVGKGCSIDDHKIRCHETSLSARLRESIGLCWSALRQFSILRDNIQLRFEAKHCSKMRTPQIYSSCVPFPKRSSANLWMQGSFESTAQA